MQFRDSIFALSSGRLPAGVAVIRISGPQTRFVSETMIGKRGHSRLASLTDVRGLDGQVLDRAIAIWFEGPASFTGEDCLELHLHGGRAVVDAVLRTLAALPGLRPAEAGEFTSRAFLNGKLDLLQAEALADLISAETEAQRRFALLNSDGRQGILYNSWRHRLIQARAMIEAAFDFADESDVPPDVTNGVWRNLSDLADAMHLHCEGYAQAEMIRDGFDVVIMGAPNAGKSSLINALARRDVAIVSDEAGTTRDLVEVTLDLDGAKVRVTDTAGLRRPSGAIERIGIERAMQRAKVAHLVIELIDLAVPVAAGELDVFPDRLRVGAKRDLAELGSSTVDVAVSAVDGTGLPELLAIMSSRAAKALADDLVPSRLRHIELLRAAMQHIRTAAMMSEAPELKAEELRLASDLLGRLTGAIGVEDLLGEIFANFCIGK